MNFESNRIVGGIGALLLFIGVIPMVNQFGIVSLIGAIMVLIALRGFASYYREAGIFNNALYGTIMAIVGVVVSVAVVIAAALGFISTFIPGWNGDWTSLSQLNPADINTNVDFAALGPFLAAILLALVLLFVFVLVVAFLYRKSLNMLSQKSGVGLFGSAATVLLIGAVLTIIVVGLLLVWISVLLVAIAFFQMKPIENVPSVTLSTV
jgi:uncharacterized membrane protein